MWTSTSTLSCPTRPLSPSRLPLPPISTGVSPTLPIPKKAHGSPHRTPQMEHCVLYPPPSAISGSGYPAATQQRGGSTVQTYKGTHTHAHHSGTRRTTGQGSSGLNPGMCGSPAQREDGNVCMHALYGYISEGKKARAGLRFCCCVRGRMCDMQQHPRRRRQSDRIASRLHAIFIPPFLTPAS